MHSLGQLIESKHANCIADRLAKLETATADAARQEGLGFFSTLMAGAVTLAANERRAVDLQTAKEGVNSTKAAAEAAEKHAEAARIAEAEASAIFVAPRNAAEKEAATLAAAAAAARHVLSELQGDLHRGGRHPSRREGAILRPPRRPEVGLLVRYSIPRTPSRAPTRLPPANATDPPIHRLRRSF